MGYLKRNIDETLLLWKTDADRKPLLLRGARQVGKYRIDNHLTKQQH